jgi:hypothetical protein
LTGLLRRFAPRNDSTRRTDRQAVIASGATRSSLKLTALAVLIVVVAFSLGFGFGDSAQADPSASGTSIPITKGGTGATTAAGALTNLLPDFGGNDGKVLGLSGGTPSWVAQTGGSATAYMFPDYANMETTNNRVISVSNYALNDYRSNIWTVEKDGYVYASITADANNSFGIGLWVNGTKVYGIVSRTVQAGDIITYMVQVSAGDKMQLSSNLSVLSAYFMCFIPPKYSTPPQPIVVEGGDYDKNERQVMVNDNGTQRPKLSVNRKPIYVRTFERNYTAYNTDTSAAGTSEILSDDNNIEMIVDQEVVFVHSGNTWSVNGEVYYSGGMYSSPDGVNGGPKYVMQITSNGNDIHLWRSIYDSGYTDGTYYLTAYYTKTTDAPL